MPLHWRGVEKFWRWDLELSGWVGELKHKRFESGDTQMMMMIMMIMMMMTMNISVTTKGLSDQKCCHWADCRTHSLQQQSRLAVTIMMMVVVVSRIKSREKPLLLVLTKPPFSPWASRWRSEQGSGWWLQIVIIIRDESGFTSCCTD